MARNGSGTYELPHPPVETGHTIESIVYNGFTADVAGDLNTARPILYGGTGENNAVAALDALGGEVRQIQVTNYDSHVFKPGSFYSLAGATNAPVAGHAFAGICYNAVIAGLGTTDMFIEARDLGDAVTIPPIIYVRQKVAGVWGAWMVPSTSGIDPHFSGVLYINNEHVMTTVTTPQKATTLYSPEGQITDGPALSISNNTGGNIHRAQTHTFGSLGTGGISTTWLTVNSTAATFSVPATLTTAPAAGDNSNKVPTTNWVQTQVASSFYVSFAQNIRNATYTLAIGDAGKQIYHASSDATTRTWTIPSNATVAFPIGTTIMLINQGGAITLTIAGGDALYHAGTANTGTRTLSGTTASMATILKVTSTSWIIWGYGVT
jgi:hypothetical protein